LPFDDNIHESLRAAPSNYICDSMFSTINSVKKVYVLPFDDNIHESLRAAQSNYICDSMFSTINSVKKSMCIAI